MRQLERAVLLQIIDERWREHLYDMDYLREGIHLRGFAQLDPLVEYKNEGFDAVPRPHELDLGGLRPLHLPRARSRSSRAQAAAFGSSSQTQRTSSLTYTGGGRRAAVARCTTRPRRAASPRGVMDGEGEEFAALPEVETRHVDDHDKLGPQRPVLVRLGQEVQEVPWRIANRSSSRAFPSGSPSSATS